MTEYDLRTTHKRKAEDTQEVQFLAPHGTPGVYLARIVSSGELVYAPTPSTYALIDGLCYPNEPQEATTYAIDEEERAELEGMLGGR